MALNKAYLKSDRTISGDEVYTPFYAVEPLFEFISKDKVIWCPFDEEWSAYYQMFTKTDIKSSAVVLQKEKIFSHTNPKNIGIY